MIFICAVYQRQIHAYAAFYNVVKSHVIEVKKTVIARLTPRLTRKTKPQLVGEIPISGRNLMAADSKGFVWAPDATFTGQYVSLKTNRGTVHLSYQPFKGSKEIGFAKSEGEKSNRSRSF